MLGVNEVTLIGVLGSEPKIFNFENGKRANISIACGEFYFDKNENKRVEKTEWVNCFAVGRYAEIIEDFLSKGSRVFIKGKITTRSYVDNQGNNRNIVEVKINKFLMLSSNNVENVNIKDNFNNENIIDDMPF